MVRIGNLGDWKVLCVAVLLAGLSAVLGSGLSTERVITPGDSRGLFRQIAPDGWIERGSQIRLNDLAPFGNRAALTFDAWRPEQVGPATLLVKVCGELRSSFEVTPQSAVHQIQLRGTCEPRLIEFDVVNPFVPSARDRREVGVKLTSISVGSRLGIPIRDFTVLTQRTVLILLLTVLIFCAFLRSPTLHVARWLPLVLVPLCAGLLLSHADDRSSEKLLGLWLLSASVGVGLLVASFVPERVLRERGPAYEASSGVSTTLLVLVIVLGAGVLRAWGLSFGLPSNYHPDEVPKVNAIMRMVEAGNLDPQYFLHPSLLLYSSYLVNSIIHWLGLPLGEWLSIPGDFRSTQFFAGRIVSLIAGTASVWLLYRIGTRLFSRDVGVVAALLLAVFPLHVACSRYMKEDALLTFMLLATILTLLKAVQEDRKGILLFAGFLAGVCASSKYSGLLAVGVVASAPWLRSRSFKPDWSYFAPTLGALAMAPLGFLVCTPYALLTYEKFFKDFRSERNHMLRGHTIPIDAWSQFWMYHFWRSVIPGASTAATLVALGGVGVLLWRRRIEDLFVVGLVLTFYLPAEWVKAKPEPQPERYIFPCLPFLALAAGEFIRMLRAFPIRGLAPVALALAFLFPLTRSVQLASEVPVDTRDMMAQWMVENLPHGSKVYLDWKPYAPRFWNNEFQVTYIPRDRLLEWLAVENLRNSDQNYLVLSSLFYDRYFSQPLALKVFQEHLKGVYENVPVVVQFAPRYGTYGFNNPSITLFSLQKDDFARLDAERAAKAAGEIEKTSNEVKAKFVWEK